MNLWIKENPMRTSATCLLLLLPSTLPAQSDDARDALAVVERMFAALKAGDTAAMRATMHPAARIIQTGTREGAPFARVNALDDFLKSIGGAALAGRKLEERIYHPELRVDDNLVTVWLRYDFLVDGTVSHCGVDSFQVVRTADGWRVIHVVDTQRRGPVCADIATAAQAAHDQRVDYVEIPVTDLARAKRFYQDVFQWPFTDYGPDYTSFADGRLTGGLRKVERAARSGVLVVIYARDLAATRQRVLSAGGKIVVETHEFPGGKRFHFADPSGNELAVWSDR
jgi:predicted enzyme related to lactoylglutathione lyase